MGTRALIGQQLEDRSIRYIYNHWDGYPDCLGKRLVQDFQTSEKVSALLDRGDCSHLDQSYFEMRGEICPAEIYPSLNDYLRLGYTYQYLFTLTNKWVLFQGGSDEEISLEEYEITLPSEEAVVHPPQTAQDMAILDVIEERQRQTEKWGEQNHDMFVWTSILGEEVGELSQAILHTVFGGNKGGPQAMYDETMQVAAVGVQIMEYLRKTYPEISTHPDPMNEMSNPFVGATEIIHRRDCQNG